MESKEILTLRRMSWNRANGELNAFMETFWSSCNKEGKDIDNGFELFSKIVRAFQKEMKDNL